MQGAYRVLGYLLRLVLEEYPHGLSLAYLLGVGLDLGVPDDSYGLAEEVSEYVVLPV